MDAWSGNLIDSIANIAHQRIYVFSGTNDNVVTQKAVNQVVGLYRAYTASTNIRYDNTIPAGHTYPTDFDVLVPGPLRSRQSLSRSLACEKNEAIADSSLAPQPLELHLVGFCDVGKGTVRLFGEHLNGFDVDSVCSRRARQFGHRTKLERDCWFSAAREDQHKDGADGESAQRSGAGGFPRIVVDIPIGRARRQTGPPQRRVLQVVEIVAGPPNLSLETGHGILIARCALVPDRGDEALGLIDQLAYCRPPFVGVIEVGCHGSLHMRSHCKPQPDGPASTGKPRAVLFVTPQLECRYFK